ncbi:TPK1 [Branchiostoma lanceolatum]|uniref:Thiamine pyrophosphokinase n=1 Tax=Branchiostoma lanceolatum TaxID=7740 RepID=A0A8J9WI46_BRALA|nr:TPK1 [Branchiostoma lanceolatum]
MTSASATVTELTPLACLDAQNEGVKIALIVLNQPQSLGVLAALWSKAVLKAVTDGGVNRLFNITKPNTESWIPDLITGDFDSASPENLQFYKNKCSEVICTPDQDYTDFTKCLQLVVKKIQERNLQVDYIVSVGAFGGRMDQVMANINTLYEARSLTSTPVILLDDVSMACLLDPGKTVLHVQTGREGEWCGLVPVGGTCQHVTTTGLKWNLNDQPLKFGDLISTSNTFDQSASGLVTVETSHPLLWTMGVKMP